MITFLRVKDYCPFFLLITRVKFIINNVCLFSGLQKSVEPLQKLFDKYVAKMFEFRRLNCKELVPTTVLNGVSSLCCLLDALATVENGVSLCHVASSRQKTWE